METIAFRMRLKPGCETEYQRRHDEIWPELSDLLHDAGIRDYTIWLDPETLYLFAILKRKAFHGMDRLPKEVIMMRWWAHMADIMEVNDDNSPVVCDLRRVFHMD